MEFWWSVFFYISTEYVFSTRIPDAGKYGPEKTLDSATFRGVVTMTHIDVIAGYMKLAAL